MRRILNCLAAIFVTLAYATLAHAQVSPPLTLSQLRNQIICGDFSVCPNQRGTSSVGGNITSTGTMTLDGWEAIGGASSSINVSSVAPTSAITGVSKALQFQRTAANTDVAVINVGQVVDTDSSTFMEGKYVCFGFDVQSLANFSAANALMTWTVTAGTGTAQGYSSMVAGTWTGAAVVLTGGVNVTTLPQRVSGCALAPGGQTEMGINFSYIPVGTAGTSDALQFTRVQLAVVQSVIGKPATEPAFGYRTSQQELWLAQKRAYVVSEPAANSIVAIGNAETSTQCDLVFLFPTQMRAAPTFAASTVTSGTTWQAFAAGVQANLSAIAIYATAVQTTTRGPLKVTTSGMTAGQACGLVGKGGAATLTWSADLL